MARLAYEFPEADCGVELNKLEFESSQELGTFRVLKQVTSVYRFLLNIVLLLYVSC